MDPIEKLAKQIKRSVISESEGAKIRKEDCKLAITGIIHELTDQLTSLPKRFYVSRLNFSFYDLERCPEYVKFKDVMDKNNIEIIDNTDRAKHNINVQVSDMRVHINHCNNIVFTD